MRSVFCVGIFALIMSCIGSSVAAQQVRFYSENGVTYKETRETVRYPVNVTTTESREQTFYRRELVTETQPSTTTTYLRTQKLCPKTHWVGRWNPFVTPYPVTSYVPCTQYQPQTQTVNVQVQRWKLVPETRTVQVPVTKQRFEEKEVIRRLAVGRTGVPSNPQSVIASQPTRSLSPSYYGPSYGGVARLENDPPRHGTVDGWRSAAPTIRR